jgi:glycosyltransferase involved in cell wall biosynthesis
MRIAIFNEHWLTLGGGEQSALQIAAALQDQYDVSLISYTDLDKSLLEEHCNTDLCKVQTYRTLPNIHAVESATANFDVFINHSHQSHAKSFASHSVYQVMFPQKIKLGSDHKLVRSEKKIPSAKLFNRVWGPKVELNIDGSLSVVDSMIAQIARQFDDSSLSMVVSSPNQCMIRWKSFDKDRRLLSEGDCVILNTAVVEIAPIASDGYLIFSVTDHRGTAFGQSCHIRLFVAESIGQATGAEIASQFVRLPEPQAEFLKFYGTFVSNSEYTRTWTKRYLSVDSQVIYPPVSVSQTEHSVKKPKILNIGRFFAGQNLHSKNQLEMVELFKKMPDEILENWELVLIGGTSRDHSTYATAVRRAARGFPIRIYFNADRSIVFDELAEASLYWHFSGLKSDLSENPESAEHFGISIVEAMRAGAVPIVFNAGGPVEILSEFKNLLFDSEDQAMATTVQLMSDPSKMNYLSQQMRDLSQRFSVEKYHTQWQSLINQIAGS